MRCQSDNIIWQYITKYWLRSGQRWQIYVLYIGIRSAHAPHTHGVCDLAVVSLRSPAIFREIPTSVSFGAASENLNNMINIALAETDPLSLRMWDKRKRWNARTIKFSLFFIYWRSHTPSWHDLATSERRVVGIDALWLTHAHDLAWFGHYMFVSVIDALECPTDLPITRHRCANRRARAQLVIYLDHLSFEARPSLRSVFFASDFIWGGLSSTKCCAHKHCSPLFRQFGRANCRKMRDGKRKKPFVPFESHFDWK